MLGQHPSGFFVVLTANGGTLSATLRADAPGEMAPLGFAPSGNWPGGKRRSENRQLIVVYTDETGEDGTELHVLSDDSSSYL